MDYHVAPVPLTLRQAIDDWCDERIRVYRASSDQIRVDANSAAAVAKDQALAQVQPSAVPLQVPWSPWNAVEFNNAARTLPACGILTDASLRALPRQVRASVASSLKALISASEKSRPPFFAGFRAARKPNFGVRGSGAMVRLRRVNDTDAPIRIVADDRENAGGVIAELRGRDEVALEVRRLGSGDFLVEDNFSVERKTLRDFAASVIDARLFKQAAAMAVGARRGVIVLEGRASTAGDLGVSRAALQGALITVSVFYGLAVLRASDRAETARLLVYLGRQAKRFAHGVLPRPGYRPKGKRARQLFILQGLPGIGPERAERLLDRFGSVENVAKASADELASIDGIGGSIAAKVRWAVEESPARYKI